MEKKFFLLLWFFTSSTLLLNCVFMDVFAVQDGSHSFTEELTQAEFSIQGAINNASEGEKILVSSGSILRTCSN